MAKAKRIQAAGVGRLPVFSHAVRAGEFLFLSGMLGTCGDGFELAEGGVGAQTRQALENIGRILAAADARFEDLVNVKVFLVDMTRFGDMNDAYQAFFPADPPSRITVGCSALALGAVVEIEAVAYLPREG